MTREYRGENKVQSLFGHFLKFCPIDKKVQRQIYDFIIRNLRNCCDYFEIVILWILWFRSGKTMKIMFLGILFNFFFIYNFLTIDFHHITSYYLDFLKKGINFLKKWAFENFWNHFLAFTTYLQCPWNSWCSYFMISPRNQKSWIAGTRD